MQLSRESDNRVNGPGERGVCRVGRRVYLSQSGGVEELDGDGTEVVELRADAGDITAEYAQHGVRAVQPDQTMGPTPYTVSFGGESQQDGHERRHHLAAAVAARLPELHAWNIGQTPRELSERAVGSAVRASRSHPLGALCCNPKPVHMWFETTGRRMFEVR